jgi:lipoprotein-releasing system ATP-binding protein
MTNSTRDPSIVLRAENLAKTYDEGASRVEVLRDVNLTVQAHEMVAIVGASGSGKSTLLHVLGLLDQADAGKLWVAGEAASGLNERRRSQLRNRALGFVYQFHHLLPEFSALDNVAMPLIVRGMRRPQARQQAQALLQQVGLPDRASHFPGQLSGGERQRVALARALVTQPACVLADEPTGNLDEDTALQVSDALYALPGTVGSAVVVVTHDTQVAKRAERCISITRGTLNYHDAVKPGARGEGV